MAAPLTLGQITDLTNLAIQKIFKKDAGPEPQFRKYFNFRTTDDYIEKDSSLSGLGEADFVDENAEIYEDVPLQGYSQSYTQTMVAITAPFSWQSWKFGIKRRNLDNIATELKEALNRIKEKLSAEYITNGFSTSFTHKGPSKNTTITNTGGDGVKAFSSAHTREDGGTNMNNAVYDGTTYSLVFNYAGYKAANRTASLMVDPRGNPRPAKLDTLLCKYGSSVYHQAMEDLGAMAKNRIPESNDNDGSALPTFDIIALDYLTSDTTWAMFQKNRALTDREGFQFIESEANFLQPVFVVPKTQEMQFVAHTIFQLGFNDVTRSWVGSAGDNSSN